MSLTLGLLLSQAGLAFAVMSQALEHKYASGGERRLFTLRAIAAATLILGIMTGLAPEALANETLRGWFLSEIHPFATREGARDALNLFAQAIRAMACWAIGVLGLLSLKRFGGPYCGGSDLMTLQLTFAMAVAESTTSPAWRLGAAGYLGIQLCLSYWQSGWVKLTNHQWRSGRAMREVFAFTHYPVSRAVRHWAKYPLLLLVMSWLIMLVEFCFPLTLLSPLILYAALGFMALFHLANAWLFGLNRFLWIWLATYPTLIALAPLLGTLLRH